MSKTSITGALISVEIDKHSDKPIYRQIADHLREAVQCGRIAVGAKLPSTRILAEELRVSRNTILQVFEILLEEGYLISRVGAGTFVAGEQPRELSEGMLPQASPDRRPFYPFRSLSRRGKGLVYSATGAFSERPTPFMPDLPDIREFPIRTWLRLLNETSGRLTGEILTDASNAGYEPLRQAIAQHLNVSRGMACSPAEVIITTGSQQSLDLVCRMLLDPGDPVWLEEPGYTGARAVIRGNGGAIYLTPVDEEGMCVESALLTHPVPRMIFTVPARHYPLGPTLSRERREALIEISRRSGSWIVEDDYDHEFRYSGAYLPSIHGLDRGQRTFHIGTFSKILLPSFRLGYVVVPPDFAADFATARAVVDRHASLIEQMVLSEFMHRGLLAAHIRRMRSLYGQRQQQLIGGLRDCFGSDLPLRATDTGTHVVLPLAASADDAKLAGLAADAGVIMRPLSPYYAGRRSRQGLLLGFSAFNPAEITKGLERLATLRDVIGRQIQE